MNGTKILNNTDIYLTFSVYDNQSATAGLSWSDPSTSILGKKYVDNELLFPTFNLTCLLSFQDPNAVPDDGLQEA